MLEFDMWLESSLTIFQCDKTFSFNRKFRHQPIWQWLNSSISTFQTWWTEKPFQTRKKKCSTQNGETPVGNLIKSHPASLFISWQYRRHEGRRKRRASDKWVGFRQVAPQLYTAPPGGSSVTDVLMDGWFLLFCSPSSHVRAGDCLIVFLGDNVCAGWLAGWMLQCDVDDDDDAAADGAGEGCSLFWDRPVSWGRRWRLRWYDGVFLISTSSLRMSDGWMSFFRFALFYWMEIIETWALVVSELWRLRWLKLTDKMSWN